MRLRTDLPGGWRLHIALRSYSGACSMGLDCIYTSSVMQGGFVLDISLVVWASCPVEVKRRTPFHALTLQDC